MLSDLRLAFRQMAKAPGFTTIIILTLALGIGACTAIYSALDAIVLNPYDDPATKRNVRLTSVRLPDRTPSGELSIPDFRDVEKRATSFEFMAQQGFGAVHLTGVGEPLRLRWLICTERTLDMFGIKMALGRTFLPEEFEVGKGDVVVLTHDCWQRVFGGAADIVGRTVQIDDTSRTIIGVLSERFQRLGLPAEVLTTRVGDLPIEPDPRDPRSVRQFWPATARLRQGVTLKQAQVELDVIAAALAEAYPNTNKGYGISAEPAPIGPNSVAPVIQVLFGAACCVLLIACANVASLLLVRANGRQREMSVRAALGASRGRLVRQLLTENILVALLGGAGGVLLAHWALEFIRTTATAEALGRGAGRLAHLEFDGGVLAFAFGLSIVTAFVFGLAPALLSSPVDLNGALRQATRGNTEGRSRGRFRATLVVIEIAAAITLLACGGLLIRSFLRMAAYEPGFDPKHTAFVLLTMKGSNYGKADQLNAFANAVVARVQSAPGVKGSGTTSYFPLSGRSGRRAGGFQIDGELLAAPGERPIASYIFVSPDYFRTLGIALKQGRFFAEFDDAKAPKVAIVNQTLVRRHFPNQNPIGRRITLTSGAEGWREIVGVVGDVGQYEIGEIPPPQIYEPMAQKATLGSFYVVVRGHGDPATLPALVKREVNALDPNLPVVEMSTVEDFLHARLSRHRLTLQLLTAFGLVGLIIAAIGIYAVMAFSVSQRTAEIGIRMALGARKQQVLALVLGQGAWLVGAGFALGLLGAFVAGRLIQTQLYATSIYDPVALAGVTVLFAALAGLACWLPARRAMKVDPIVALRAE